MGCTNCGKGSTLAEPPDAIKEYIATNYGDGTCVTSDTGDNLGVACMTGNLITPLPTGYTTDDICAEEIISWAYNNVGWCKTAPTTGSISVSSTPSGAEIFIDGVDQGQVTPHTITGLTAASHTVKLTLSGYNDYTIQIPVTAGGTSTVNAVLTPSGPTTGSISCSSTPTGATVSVAGKTGTTPCTLTGIPEGTQTVTYTKSGYQQCTDTVTVVAGGSVSSSCTLQETPAGTGYVHIGTPTDNTTGQDITSVEIYVDDVYIHHYAPEDLTFGPGKTIGGYVSAEFGSHTIRLVKTNYDDWTQTVNVQDGSDITLTPSMTPTAGTTPTIEVVANLTGSITSWNAPDIGTPSSVLPITATCLGDDNIDSNVKLVAILGSQTAESALTAVAAGGTVNLSVNVPTPASEGIYTLTVKLMGTVQDITPVVLDTKTKSVTISSQPPPENLVIEPPHTIPSKVGLGETANFGVGITNYRTTSASIYVVLQEIHQTKAGVMYSQQSQTVTITAGDHMQVPVSWPVAADTPLGKYDIYALLYEAGLGILGRVPLTEANITPENIDLEKVARERIRNLMMNFLGGV